MNKWLELLLGLILVVIPILLLLGNSWGDAAVQFIKGGIGVGIVLIGLMFIMLGISDISS